MQCLRLLRHSGTQQELLDIRTVVTHQHYDQEHDFPEFDSLFVAPRAIELIPDAAPRHRQRREVFGVDF
jgi:phosphoribosyl 1,2-cyclic phosphodiesterase